MSRLFGMRILKTTLAVFICLLLFHLIGYGLPVYAALACVLVMKSTPEQSIQVGTDRAIGTAIGCMLAAVALWLCAPIGMAQDSLGYIFVITATIFIDLILCKVTHQREYAYSISCVLILIVMIQHDTSDSFFYAIYRMLETLAGIGIAVLVNKYVNPKRACEKKDDAPPAH